MSEQLSIFDIIRKPFAIDKPIRLIEAFCGIGATSMALRNMGVKFDHYRAYDFDKYKIMQYNAIHGTEFDPTDICEVHGKDLGIVDKDIHTYILTYSYPCQDISLAGERKGMEEGSGTRSSLVWELKRILDESNELPDVLLLENVSAVRNEQNLPEFQRWMLYLESKGYSNYVDSLNAKDYGTA